MQNFYRILLSIGALCFVSGCTKIQRSDDLLVASSIERRLDKKVKWLAKAGHKIGKNKLSFAPINKKVEGKQNGTQKAQRRIQG